MRDTVYFLVFDGFADRQAALALCEIRRPGDWQVCTVGFSDAPVVSMGGLTVQPGRVLAQLDPSRAALLIVPGGHLGSAGKAPRRWPRSPACMPPARRWPASTAACWRWPAPAC